MVQLKSSLIIASFLVCFSQGAISQTKKKKDAAKPAITASETPKPEAKKGPKPYNKVIDTTAVTQKGLIDIHKMDAKYLFEMNYRKTVPQLKRKAHLLCTVYFRQHSCIEIS
jgi:hypothetical protein